MGAGHCVGRDVTSHEHRHAGISRRALLAAAAGTGVAVATGVIPTSVRQALAATEDPRPRPIPGGIAVGGQGFHVNNAGPAVGTDPTTIDDLSSITDFDGVLGCSHIQGTGTGTDKSTGISQPMSFDTDMRFMEGTYVAMDGKRRTGHFGFI